MLDQSALGAAQKPGLGTKQFPGLGPQNREVLLNRDILSTFQGNLPLAQAKSGPARKSNPTLDQVVKKADADVEFWKARNERMRDHQDKIRLRKPDDLEDDEEAVVVNDPLALLLKITGMLSKQPHQNEVRPRRPDLKDSAQAVENGLRLFDTERDVRWSDGLHGPVKYEELFFGLSRGWFAARIGFNAEAASNWDGDPYEYFPWDVHLCDPAQVYPNNATENYTRVTYRYKTTAEDLRDTSDYSTEVPDDWDDEDAIEVTGVYEFNKRWDYHCIYVSQGKDRRFLKKPQPLGYMPWVLQIAGGFPFRGTPWEEDDDHGFTKYVGVGILHAIDAMLDYTNRYMSMWATMVGDNANPFTAIISDNPEDEAPQGGFKRGSSKRFRKDTKIEQLTKEKGLEAVAPLVQYFQGKTDKLLPPAMWGMAGAEGAIPSGFQASLFMAMAADLITPYIKGWELFRQKLYRKVLEVFGDMAPLDKPLMVMLPPNGQNPQMAWTEFYPEDVAEQGTAVAVTLDPLTIQDRVTLGSLAVQLVDKNIISRETARGADFIRIADPSLENLKIVGEQVYMHPLVMETLAPLALSETGEAALGQIFQMSLMRQQAIQAGMPDPGNPMAQQAAAQGLPSQVQPPQAAGMNQRAAIARRGAPRPAATGGIGGGGVPPSPPGTNQPQPL